MPVQFTLLFCPQANVLPVTFTDCTALDISKHVFSLLSVKPNPILNRKVT